MRTSFCSGECRWLKEQKARRQTIHDACVEYGNVPNITKENLKQILVSDKHKTLYCSVPKVACTTWKKILLLLNGQNFTDVHHAKIPKLSQFSKEEIEKRLRNYKKFIIVRNPHSRVLSAYNEKFAHVSQYNKYILKHFGRRIRIQNIKNLINKYYSSDSHMSSAFSKWSKTVQQQDRVFVTFQEFLRYVGNWKNQLNEPTEIHWREIYRLCNPCAVDFDFIGKLETAADDSLYILKQIGASHLISETKSKPHATNSSSEDKVQKAFERVTEKDILRFEKRFAKDFALFGYQRPSAITKLKTEEADVRDSMKKLKSIDQK